MKELLFPDFKSFVNNIHLKILLIREYFSTACGPEDAIFYSCPKCQIEDGSRNQQRKRYIYRLLELVAANDGESELLCPSCYSTLDELDDTIKVNAKKKTLQAFVELTNPLLALIHQTRGLVMLDDPLICVANRIK
jgi:hypothetical protein